MVSIKKHLLAAALVLTSGTAMASTCASILSSIQSGACNASCQQFYLENHPECFAGGSTTSTTQINATAFTQAAAISSALSARIRQASPKPVALSDKTTGLAAGGSQSWNAWASHSENNSSVRVNNGAGRNDTDIGTTVLGGDFALSPIMSLGLSVAFDRGEGSSLAGNTNNTHGYMVAPYIGYQINQNMAVDLSAGLGRGKFSSGGTNSDADRTFASANLSYSTWMSDWQITGKLGYMHGEEKYSGVTASKNTVDQARAGVQAGYWMSGFMPYAGLTYAADIHRSSSAQAAVDPLGRGAFVIALGINFFSLTSKISGGIAYEQESGRSNSKNETLMANLNFRF